MTRARRQYSALPHQARRFTIVAHWSLIWMVVAGTTYNSSAGACERAAPWSRLPSSAVHAATPVPLVLLGGAFLAPFLLAPTGADHELRVLSQRSLGGKPNLEPVSVWTPFVLPVVLIGTDVVALLVDACDVARPTSAMLQAMGITFMLVTGLKWTTGRSWPNAGGDPNAADRLSHPEFARRFDWFSWQNGSAWPSGHTATMVAAATALTTATHGRSWVGYLTIAAAAGVASGMWLGDHHWASDIVSGALLGSAIGHSTGLAFRNEPDTGHVSTPMLLPWLGRTHQGLELVGAF